MNIKMVITLLTVFVGKAAIAQLATQDTVKQFVTGDGMFCVVTDMSNRDISVTLRPDLYAPKN